MSDDFVEEFDTDDEEQPQLSASEVSTNILTNSENTNNENREKELNESTATIELDENLSKSSNEAFYIANTTYTSDGKAIFTDPQTKFQYQWCTKENKWVPFNSSDISQNVEGNHYENEYYFWCSESNEWKLKAAYNYDEALKKWLPKDETNDTSEQLKGVKIDGTRTYTDNDGVAYEWDEEKKAWFPKIDDDFMAIYQLNYGNYVPTEKEEENKKRSFVSEEKPESSSENLDDGRLASKRSKRKPEAPKWFEIAPEYNNKVYVENLPLDISEEEFVELMSKYGMIFKDPSTNKFKVKLYRNSDGTLKGDGLCTYIKVKTFFCITFFYS